MLGHRLADTSFGALCFLIGALLLLPLRESAAIQPRTSEVVSSTAPATA